jgi:FKBP-type peptidyl-prolyl cis-trans isomerase
MARARDRIIALVLAIVFFATSVGIGLLVVWQTFVEENNTAANQELEQENPMLQGTQLADFTPIQQVSDLQIIDIENGSGQEVKPGDTDTVDYTGAVAATGVIFQSSKDFGEPVSFPLDGVIAGWTEGIPGMKEGGTRRLVIPAEKAYGANPPEGSGIPANAALVFDVTLHGIGGGEEQ